MTCSTTTTFSTALPNCLFFFSFFKDKSHYADLDGLELSMKLSGLKLTEILPASALLRLKECTPMPNLPSQSFKGWHTSFSKKDLKKKIRH